MSATATFDPFAPTVPTPGTGSELLNAGDYLGALVGLIDLGTHANTYKGVTKSQRQILFVWELEEEKEDGTRHLVAVQYNNSMNEKAGVRLMIERSQRVKLEGGQRYPYRELLGKSFNVTIENTTKGDRTYHRVSKDGIGPLHKRDKPIPPDEQREHCTYSLADGPPDEAKLAHLPYVYGRPVVELIRECDELGGPRADPTPNSAATAGEPANKAEAIVLVEECLAKAREAADPADPKGDQKGPDFDRAMKLMARWKVDDEELADECQGQLIPF